MMSQAVVGITVHVLTINRSSSEVALATLVVERVRQLTDRDFANRSNLTRVPAWRQAVAQASGDVELADTDTLLRALCRFWVDGPEAALSVHARVTRPSLDRQPTRTTWLYWNLGGLLASAGGDLERSLLLFRRAADVARSLGMAEYLEVSLTNLGYACEKSGRFDESLSCLMTVIRDSSNETGIAIASEIWAESLDRFQLFDLARPHWVTAIGRIPTNEVNLRCRVLVGLLRSSLHEGAEGSTWLLGRLDELRSLADEPGVSAEVRSRAGVVLGWWAVAHGDGTEASRLLAEFGVPLLRNDFPVHTVEAAHLQALIASFERRFDDVASAVDLVDSSKAATHDVEAILRVLIDAQNQQGALQAQDETYQRLSALQSATSRDRERMAYFAHTRQIVALEHSRLLLKEAMADRDSLLRVLSHELRQPLATMSLDLGRLRVVSSVGSMRAPRLVNQAYDHMLELVNHLSLIGEVEGAALAVNLQTVDVGAIVARSCQRVARSVSSKGQVLTWNPPREPIKCTADPRWLSIIVDNLLGNATKFCDRDDRIEIGIERDARAVTLIVTDSGPGFAPSEKSALFRQYSRLAAAPTNGEPTNGLGLYLSAQVASKMGAIIDAHSAGVGLGASFTVRLPQ